MDITKLLNPQKVCVVGASEKEGFGGDTCRNIIKYMDLSRVYFVNPKRDSVFGVKCYKSISELPENIDLVVICTPKTIVNSLLKEASDKGAKGAVVFASGYSEVGTAEGQMEEEELKSLCRKLDIALMGPNCAGFVNYSGGVNSFAFISNHRDRRGSVGLISQSGQICLSMMESPNMKFSYIISAGNSSIVEIEDYLDYLVEDKKTRVVAIYLEGIKNPKKFEASLKKAALKRKPVVILKVGRSEKGGSIASSHTGSLAGADKVYDAVFKKFGVIRVDDIEELLATSLMLSILPKYPKIGTFATMSLSGGETGVCADLGFMSGIEYPDFEQSTIDKLNDILPYYATPNNPLDMTASLSYDSDLYATALRTVMSDPNIGMVVIGYTLLEEIADPAIYYMAEGMEKVAKEDKAKPMVMMPFVENTRNPEYCDKLEKIGVPVLPPTVYAFKMLRYLADFVNYDPGKVELSLAVPSCKIGNAEALTEYESKNILKNYGIPIPQEKVAVNADEAVKFANSIGYPVVMKIDSKDILHKSDIGAVKLRVKSENEVRCAFAEIIDSVKKHKPDARIGGILVQEMREPGLEVIIGVNNDPQFGPCVLCGLGGIFVEVFKDSSLCPAPVSKSEALNMINSLKASKLFKGYRGKPELDIEALAHAIVNISHFACDYKDSLRELDINPIFVYEKGICAVDALIVKK